MSKVATTTTTTASELAPASSAEMPKSNVSVMHFSFITFDNFNRNFEISSKKKQLAALLGREN